MKANPSKFCKDKGHVMFFLLPNPFISYNKYENYNCKMSTEVYQFTCNL